MARVLPFRPYRYAAGAGPLERLVTQPYDKISAAMQQRYLGLDAHNLVRVILGPRRETDTAADNVYTRAAKYFEEWIAGGVLVQEAEPALYAYFQEFEAPDTSERVVRKGFIGLGAVEDYAKGIVHRHEETLAGPKKDRMLLLEHTRAHFGQIFMLYPDTEGAVDRLLDEAAAQPPLGSVKDEYGAAHTLWKVSHPARIEHIRDLMSDKKLIIADGHHRYETALAFREAHPELEGARAVMMTFVNLHSPGLKILPTHRVLDGLADFDLELFLREARAEFAVTPAGSVEELRRVMAAPQPGRIRIGAVAGRGEKVFCLERERQAGDLDVSILHRLLIQEALGVSQDAVREEKNIRYVRGIDAALERSAQIAFLLEPTSIEDVVRVSLSGGVMPQKSTDFYPKLLSGMCIYRLETRDSILNSRFPAPSARVGSTSARGPSFSAGPDAAAATSGRVPAPSFPQIPPTQEDAPGGSLPEIGAASLPPPGSCVAQSATGRRYRPAAVAPSTLLHERRDVCLLVRLAAAFQGPRARSILSGSQQHRPRAS